MWWHADSQEVIIIIIITAVIVSPLKRSSLFYFSHPLVSAQAQGLFWVIGLTDISLLT